MPTLNEIQIRDPFMVRDDADYYLFGSTDPDIWKSNGIGFDVYRATDNTLTNWEGPIPAFRPDADFYSRRNFWAPEVHKVGNDWFMFATFKPFTINNDGDEVELRRGTAILKSTTGSIIGPYTPWSNGPITPAEWETLDGTLYIDDAGESWLVFCHEWQQVGDGTIEAMRLTPDLRAAASAPTTLFSASEATWSSPLKNRAPGSYVTDGPFIYRDSRGYLKCLWSSFGPEGNYLIGEAVSRNDDGTPAGILGPWHQAPEPLFSADGGHGMLFTGSDGVRYLAVHSPNKTPNERAHFIEVTESEVMPSDDQGQSTPSVDEGQSPVSKSRQPQLWLKATGKVIS